ncbi:MAG: Tartrate dehydratase alpha subunit/Fumarate hydratase class I N-terminal domain TtdA [Candidatus Methanohalarchaeum thermophilum]|uniref:Tartrate dehydratase alpha subunit/Fumarate hydratase class I N-terminal domain TtdA n=1 Tax=Methanohalarchaeum thermophilum TaxID=1903181 RepID=A0A1Q6DUD1_METT1|nr:MAG: Tartrate dehydratase alpha subunit/Fumarate hydratase class I N-terminal domain TtdA [Candidatus Methanohalarchaeum thermophilum]
MNDQHSRIVETVVELMKEAQRNLPVWVKKRLEQAKESEEGIAKQEINNMLENVVYSSNRNKPLCQDTGVPIFYIEIGRDFSLKTSIREAIRDGVKKATEEVPLRPSVVHPLSRKNSGDNTGKFVPIINTEIKEGKDLKIKLLPKGAGSENVSHQRMFLPGEKEKIPNWVKKKVKEAGPKPCPPLFLGIGIGGSFDYSSVLSKKALIDFNEKKSPDIRELEEEITKKVNELDIGPMGVGGNTTALGSSIKLASCHTASLPVALNIQCWAFRYSEETIKD